MPEVKSKPKSTIRRNHTKKASSKAGSPPVENITDTRPASVILGVFILTASVVAGAAWMGGALNRIETRLGRIADTSMAELGLVVEDIRLIGLDGQKAKHVGEQLQVDIGTNMFRVNPLRIKEQVEQSHYVANARIHRLWPNKILIAVEPSIPIALWQENQNWYVVDTKGRIMKNILPESVQHLPRIMGTGGAKHAPLLNQQLQRWPEISSRLSRSLRISDRRWDLHMKNNIEIILPEDNRLAEALAKLDQLQQNYAILDRKLTRIDLRDADRVIFKTDNNNQLGAG